MNQLNCFIGKSFQDYDDLMSGIVIDRPITETAMHLADSTLPEILIPITPVQTENPGDFNIEILKRKSSTNSLSRQCLVGKDFSIINYLIAYHLFLFFFFIYFNIFLFEKKKKYIS